MRLAITLYFCLTCQVLLAQDTLHLSCKYITSDNLDNIYPVSVKNSISKYDSKGVKIAEFQSLKSGVLQKIDASNPLRVLLFYADIQKIIYTDNKLAEVSDIELNTISSGRITQACNSTDGGTWLYDIDNRKILKTYGSNETTRQINIRNLFTQTTMVNGMWEYDAILYLSCSDGIFTFDQNGTFLTAYDLPEGSNVLGSYKKDIIYSQNGSIYGYNIDTLNSEKFSNLNIYQTVNSMLLGNKIAILGAKSVLLYEIK